MVVTSDLKRAICASFEVYEDQEGVQRVVTPLEYGGSGDRVVVRVRPTAEGFDIDENGEASLYAAMSGGDPEAEVVSRWAEELLSFSPVRFEEDEVLRARTSDLRLVTSYVFRVAEAAQQLHALATSRSERKASDFKDKVADIVQSVAKELRCSVKSDVELSIAGGMRADHVIEAANPLIVIAAGSPARLLEAEVIYMQYRAEASERLAEPP